MFEANFEILDKETSIANFELSEKEVIQTNFEIKVIPTKLSQLKNNVGYITLAEVPEGMTEEQKTRLSALNMQYKEVIVPTQELDLSAIEIDKDGAEYGFYYNQETGSLCPQNSGIDESYSYGKITFNIEQDTTVTLSFKQSSEQNYDFGVISELDTYLQHNINDDTNVKWSGNPHGQISDSVTYDVPAGEHFITFKYVKDSSSNVGNDRFEITGVAIEGFQNKKIFDYDTNEEIDLSTDLSDYYTKTEIDNNFVTVNTEQTISKKKVILCTEEVKWAGQESALKILSTHSDNELTEPMWAGRLTVGNKNQTFLMGVYHQDGSDTPMCGLGAHRWSNSLTDTGAAWNDIYIQPDGNTSVYIGGWNWTHGTGWFKVKNSGSSTGGKVQVNVGSITSPNWQDVATKNYVDQHARSLSGFDATKTQTLKNINGVLTWVTD